VRPRRAPMKCRPRQSCTAAPRFLLWRAKYEWGNRPRIYSQALRHFQWPWRFLGPALVEFAVDGVELEQVREFEAPLADGVEIILCPHGHRSPHWITLAAVLHHLSQGILPFRTSPPGRQISHAADRNVCLRKGRRLRSLRRSFKATRLGTPVGLLPHVTWGYKLARAIRPRILHRRRAASRTGGCSPPRTRDALP